MAASKGPQLLVYGLRVWALPAMDRNGKADPYLKLKVGREVFGTRAKKATLEASWDQQFYFGKKDRQGKLLKEDELIIHVWDDDLLMDELIGVVKIELGDIRDPMNPTKTVTRDILDKTGSVRGQLSAS